MSKVTPLNYIETSEDMKFNIEDYRIIEKYSPIQESYNNAISLQQYSNIDDAFEAYLNAMEHSLDIIDRYKPSYNNWEVSLELKRWISRQINLTNTKVFLQCVA